MDFQSVYERIASAVVLVASGDGHGSGFVVDSRGLVVTNRHVVEEASDVMLQLADSREVRGVVVSSSQAPDLAIVLAAATLGTSLRLAPPNAIKAGQDVIVVGHPLDRTFRNTVTRGVISSVCRLIDGVTYLQTDAALNPGNSGGPIVNRTGAVVGISTMTLRNSHGLGFAVPSSAARTMLHGVRSRWQLLPTMKYCTLCGYLNAGTLKYCERCGRPLGRPIGEHVPSCRRPGGKPPVAASWKCEACGKSEDTLPPLYCTHCGTRVVMNSG